MQKGGKCTSRCPHCVQILRVKFYRVPPKNQKQKETQSNAVWKTCSLQFYSKAQPHWGICRQISVGSEKHSCLEAWLFWLTCLVGCDWQAICVRRAGRAIHRRGESMYSLLWFIFLWPSFVFEVRNTFSTGCSFFQSLAYQFLILNNCPLLFGLLYKKSIQEFPLTHL